MQALLRALSPGLLSLRQAVPGLAVAVALSLLARLLADRIGEGIAGGPALPLSPVLIAVLLGMLWRNTLGVPGWSVEGLNWAMHGVLRTGIALIGLRLTLSGVGAIAATALPVVIGCITVALVASLVVVRLFGVPRRLAGLLAVGTAVCGCTAVIAVSPAIRAQNVETAFAATCVVLFGCIAMLFYPWVAAMVFDGSPVYAGVFLGTAIHDTSQVIGAALIHSQQVDSPEALAAASVTKLFRNLSIILIVPAAAWLASRRPNGQGGEGEPSPRTRAVPFFVIGFILFVVLRTAGDALTQGSAAASTWESMISLGSGLSELLLICGMTAVGLNVSFAQMGRIGWRPLAAGLLTAVAVGACSLYLTLLVQRFAG